MDATRRSTTLVPILLAGLAAAAVATPHQATFKARIDGVRVDVLVTDKGVPVTGLTADDFELFDNGVPQRPTLIQSGQLPASVVLALDVSESVKGELLGWPVDAVNGTLDALQPDDEAGLLVFNEAPTERASLMADIARLRALAAGTRAGGATSLHDAVYAGLVTARAGGGRRLLIVFSDGVDTASWLRETDVLRVSRRSDVLTYTVAVGGNTPPFLADLARATGGTVFEAAGNADLRNAFLKVLNESRNRYLLFCTPPGGAQPGWHAIDVRVRRHAYKIQARPGYMIDASAGGKVN
jgi:Ca-activated chloride channel family protein